MAVKKKIRTITLSVLIALPVLLVLVGVLTQTQMFRDRVRTFALSELDSLLDADVHLGALRGNLVTGFSLDSTSLLVAGRPFLRFDSLDLDYNLFALPGRRITFSRLTVFHPTIFLFRPKGGEWNISAMIRPPRDTVSSGPFNWVINIHRLEIRDGVFVLVDSTHLAQADHAVRDDSTVEYHEFALRRVNVILSAEIRNGRQHVVVDSCSFQSDRPDIHLAQLQGAFTLTNSVATVDSLRIKTGRTDLSMSASLKDVDLTKGLRLSSLRTAPVDLSLQGHAIDLDELKRFLPPIGFLTGRTDLDLQAHGEFGDLQIPRLDLRFGSTALFVKGRLLHLNEPRELTLSVKITESSVKLSDVSELMPAFDIPPLPQLGATTLNLEYEGKPLDFTTKFLLETSVGKVQSSGLSMTIGGPPVIGYKGTVRFAAVDLGTLTFDPRLRSDLNGTLVIEGAGIRMNQLASSFTLNLDSSSFRGLPVGKTSADVRAGNNTLSGMCSMRLGETHAVIDGSLHSPQGGVPSFEFSGNVSSLNLKHVLHDSTYDSDITMKLEGRGTGLTWNALNGTFTLDLSSSRYREYRLDQGTIMIRINQLDSNAKFLELTSNIADVKLTGEYDIAVLPDLIAFEAVNLRAELADHLVAIDSTLRRGIDRKTLAEKGRELAQVRSPLDAKFEVKLKDLEPLSFAAGERRFNGSGILTGELRGPFRDLMLHADISADDFFYGSADSGVLIEDAGATLDLQHVQPDQPLRGAGIQLQAHASKVHINRNRIDSLEARVDYRSERADFGVAFEFNRGLLMRVGGDARVDESGITTTINQAEMGYKGLAWRGDPGAVLRVNHAGVGISNLVLRSDTQAVFVNAYLGAGRSISAQVNGTRLNLDDLKYLLAEEDIGPTGEAFGGTGAINAAITGTLADPIYTVDMKADHVTFRTLPFGDLSASLRADKGSLSGMVNVNATGASADSTPILTINGSIPVDLRLDRRGEDKAGHAMNLRVVSRGVQMSVLDPLLPTFNQMTGTLSCNLTLGGSFEHPTYTGDIFVSQSSFLFEPNNITYTLDGEFKADGERIKVVDCVIRNIPGDEHPGRRGEVRLNGDFVLRNLRPGDFNLTAEGKLLVVKEDSRLSALSVYGDLFVEIGAKPLRFTGEIENSLLKGSLLIRNSSLVFPPTQTAVAEESPQSVPIVFVNDTLKTDGNRERSLVAQYWGGGGRRRGRSSEENIELRKGKSFMDGLHYDLDIETTGGNTEIRMIFNPATSEELVATLNGNFTITGNGTHWVGDLTIERAYYNFFKRFDATGTIRYTGDFMNPELNITATYLGNRTVPDSTYGSRTEKVEVSVKISGTRYEPKLEFSMKIDDLDYSLYHGPKSNDLQSDAIQFIVAGTFPLTSTQKNDVATEVRQTAGLSLLTGATSLLTGRLSEFLRTETNFINMVEITPGSSSQSTQLRLSGTAFNGYWQYKGTILNDPLSNANFSILYSFETIFSNPALRNFMFELQRRVELNTYGQLNDLQRINSARLFYRISF
jgi:hypothetical protein